MKIIFDESKLKRIQSKASSARGAYEQASNEWDYVYAELRRLQGINNQERQSRTWLKENPANQQQIEKLEAEEKQLRERKEQAAEAQQYWVGLETRLNEAVSAWTRQSQSRSVIGVANG